MKLINDDFGKVRVLKGADAAEYNLQPGEFILELVDDPAASSPLPLVATNDVILTYQILSTSSATQGADFAFLPNLAVISCWRVFRSREHRRLRR